MLHTVIELRVYGKKTTDPLKGVHMPRDKATTKRLKMYKEGGKAVRYAMHLIKKSVHVLLGHYKLHSWFPSYLKILRVSHVLVAGDSPYLAFAKTPLSSWVTMMCSTGIWSVCVSTYVLIQCIIVF